MSETARVERALLTAAFDSALVVDLSLMQNERFAWRSASVLRLSARIWSAI